MGKKVLINSSLLRYIITRKHLFSKKKFILLILCMSFFSFSFLCQESLSLSYEQGSGYPFGHHEIWLATIGFDESSFESFGKYNQANYELYKTLTHGNEVLQVAIDRIVPNDIFSDDIDRLKRETGIGNNILNQFNHRKVFHWGFTREREELRRFLNLNQFAGENGIHQKNRRENFTKGLIEIWSSRRERSINAFVESGSLREDEAEALATFFYDVHILADYLTKDREYLIPLQFLVREMKKPLNKLYGENNEICSRYFDERTLRTLPSSHDERGTIGHDRVAAEILNTFFEHHPKLFWDYINRKLYPNEPNFCMPQRTFSPKLEFEDDGNGGRIWYFSVF